jgi:hypothetical protein
MADDNNSVEITSEPGLADLATSELDERPYPGADVDFLNSVGADSPVGREFRRAREAARQQATEGLSWHDIVGFFRPRAPQADRSAAAHRRACRLLA